MERHSHEALPGKFNNLIYRWVRESGAWLCDGSRRRSNGFAADVDEPDHASVRVLEKLGMTRVAPEVVAEEPLLYRDAERVGTRLARSRLNEVPI